MMSCVQIYLLVVQEISLFNFSVKFVTGKAVSRHALKYVRGTHTHISGFQIETHKT